MICMKRVSAKIRVKCVVVFLNIVVGGKYFRHTLAIHFSKNKYMRWNQVAKIE